MEIFVERRNEFLPCPEPGHGRISDRRGHGGSAAGRGQNDSEKWLVNMRFPFSYSLIAPISRRAKRRSGEDTLLGQIEKWSLFIRGKNKQFTQNAGKYLLNSGLMSQCCKELKR
jgi:hypothetical protein